MIKVKWIRLVFLFEVPHPVIFRNMRGIGPVRVFHRYEMSLYDTFFVRLDYEGMFEMYLIPEEYRQMSGLAIRFLKVNWATVVHFSNLQVII